MDRRTIENATAPAATAATPTAVTTIHCAARARGLAGFLQRLRNRLLCLAEFPGRPALSVKLTQPAARQMGGVQTQTDGAACDVNGPDRRVRQAPGQPLPGCQPGPGSLVFVHALSVSDGARRPAKPAWHTVMP